MAADFCGRRVKFNLNNGAAKALQSVGDELTMLLKGKPEPAEFVLPLGGTFIRRPIAGADRHSPHSFGIAIDLNPKYGVYRRWGGTRLDGGKRAGKYPGEIVAIFEKHGFILGGKWAHFDLMHFEFRPELLMKAALVSSRS